MAKFFIERPICLSVLIMPLEVAGLVIDRVPIAGHITIGIARSITTLKGDIQVRRLLGNGKANTCENYTQSENCYANV